MNPPFGELEVIETEELAETDPGEPEGGPMQDDPENKKGLEKA